LCATRSTRRFLRLSTLLPRHSGLPAALATAATIAFVAACSSTTDSSGPPASQLTHPAGSVDSVVPIRGNVHGIGVAPNGTAIITRLDSADVVIGRIDEFAFGPVVHVGGLPVDVALTPDGRTAFVANNGGPHVDIIDVNSAAVVGELTIFSWPLRVLVTPDGNHVYVTTAGGLSDTVSRLYDFNVHTHALIDSLNIGSSANGITYNAQSKRLYVSSTASNAVYEIDATNDVILRTIHVGPVPQEIAVSADDSQLWVATEGDVGVQLYDLGTGQLAQSVDGTSRAYGLAMSPDGAQLYVARYEANATVIIDVRTRSVLKPLDLGLAPQRVAFNHVGSRAIFTAENGVILVQ
jgi:YVTN family beta-propeller protein